MPEPIQAPLQRDGAITLDLEALKISVRTEGDRHTKSVERASKFVKSILVLGGATLAGIAQFVTWPDGNSPEPWQVVGIAATFIVALGGIYSLFTEQDAANAVREAERAVEAAQEFRAQIKDFEGLFAEYDRLAETYRLCLMLRSALEQAGVGFVGDTDTQLFELFDMVGRHLAIAAGFAQADRWTIGLYKAQPSAEVGKAELRCIAQRRALPCDLTEARIWPEGVGIAGIAYTNGREVIIPDLRTDGMQAVFGPRNQSKKYDAEPYASMVAVPINVAGHEKPWGVVTATSDRVGHFSSDGDPGFKTDEPIRAFAAFVALAVAMRETISRAHAAPPIETSPEPANLDRGWRSDSVRSSRRR